MFKYSRIIKNLFPLFLVGIFFIIQAVDAQTSIIDATVQVSVCGNFVVEGGEDCDNYDFAGQTCSDFENYNAGDLNCNSDCSIDTSGCYVEENDDPPPSGGGGGGGGSSDDDDEPETSVSFSGRAYPLNKVIILKDGQVAIITIAGPDARFSSTIDELSPGNYNFAVYGEDKDGLRSTLFTFNVYVTEGASTNISGIFLAPTITTDKSQVKQGDNISIFGQTVPESEVTIAVNSEQAHFEYVESDEDGVYFKDFDTSVLELGDHTTKSKTAYENQISNYGYSVAFAVGNRNIERDEDDQDQQDSFSGLIADVNSDDRVNLVDFSIAAYWYKRSAPPSNVDLNNDGKVDLVDFSIMAYHWTG